MPRARARSRRRARPRRAARRGASSGSRSRGPRRRRAPRGRPTPPASTQCSAPSASSASGSAGVQSSGPASNAVRSTPMPCAYERCPPSQPPAPSAPAPASASSLPVPRAPPRRAASEAPNNAVAVRFVAAWTSPTRRARRAGRLGVRPLGEAASPSRAPCSRSRARSAGRRRRRASAPPSQSSSSALVHVPIGRSVSSGCSACPIRVPLSSVLGGAGRDGIRARPWRSAVAVPSTASSCSMRSGEVLGGGAGGGGRGHGRALPFAAHERPRPVRRSRPRPARRPQPPGEAQCVPRRARARHGRRAARRRRRSRGPRASCVRGAGPMFSSGMDLGSLGALARGARAPAHVPAPLPRGVEPRRGDAQAGHLRDPRRVHRRRARAGARVRLPRARRGRDRRHARDADRADPRRRRLLAAARRSSGSGGRRSS